MTKYVNKSENAGITDGRYNKGRKPNHARLINKAWRFSGVLNKFKRLILEKSPWELWYSYPSGVKRGK